jgi:hypothetical protein
VAEQVLEVAQVARKKMRRKGKYRSAISGRYVTAGHAQRSPKTTVKESRASKFAESYIERYPDTFHELSKR